MYDQVQLLVPHFSVEPCCLLYLNPARLQKRNVCQQLAFPAYVWPFIHRCNESKQPTAGGVLSVTPAANLANKTAHESTSPSSFMTWASPHAYRCSTTS